jgi:predicted MFS family arabinose efflux permease
MASRTGLSEGRLLFLIGAVQFVNVLDFMMVMPLGPDFSRALGIQTSRLGLVGGIYTLAAGISGLLGAAFLDRFDRRNALACSLFGLAIGTALGGVATGFYGLLAARALAGVFGGPATSLALAIVADAVPLERRGRAMGAVMGAFSVASVLGVPAGLELSRLGGYRMPFFAVGALCFAVNVAAYLAMPPMRHHLRAGAPPAVGLGQLLTRPLVLLSLSCTLVAMSGNFAVIPNLSAYIQFNLGYPRADLGRLYLLGGTISFLTLRIAGKLADHIGPARTALIGSVSFFLLLCTGFIWPVSWMSVLFLFVAFMVTSSFRFVPMQALSSRVPMPNERARFMSAQSAVQHFASATGAMAASTVLTEGAGGKLLGMERVALGSAVLVAILPLLIFAVERRVRARDAAQLG